MSLPAIAIFDVGKTNKKFLIFDEHYKLLEAESVQLGEMLDEDGFACEDVNEITKWVNRKFSEVIFRKDIDIKAVNFSAYGASFVYVDAKGKVITPMYNYLKPFPDRLRKMFYETYGGESKIAKETCSPVLGSLNSGMQLYRLKYEQPEKFDRVAFAFHLPQYLSRIINDFPASEITSIGCHTTLWDYRKNEYHSWVTKEGIDKKFPLIIPSSSSIPTTFQNREVEIGVGLHDSSAALIPYLLSFQEPFVLISTGTWCISLNPFDHSELTESELKQDCLCYLSYEGKPVKASRLFAGYEHEQQIKRLAEYFNKGIEHQEVEFNRDIVKKMKTMEDHRQQSFSKRDLHDFSNYEEAYHALMIDIVQQQVRSTNLVLKGTPVKRIFVDGGFGKNQVYMNLLAKSFPNIEVWSATTPQASGLGAALAIHKEWNKNLLPSGMIGLNHFLNTEMNYST